MTLWQLDSQLLPGPGQHLQSLRNLH
jgi:hypothetical protein